jgi:catechol 2,3-dioxygenase-like lactoylglutathione lyase family enzyme
MPDCFIRGVRSVELVATNFEEAARFYEGVWGLAPVHSGEGTRLYRGTAAYHHILGLHRGARPAVIRLVFDVVDRKAVDGLYRAVVASGCRSVSEPAEVRAEGGGYGFGCKDPDDRNLAFVCAVADHADAMDDPITRARSRTSISMPATSRGACDSSRRRSAFGRSTRMRRCGSCAVPVRITPRSCSPRPINPRSITSHSRCRTSTP